MAHLLWDRVDHDGHATLADLRGAYDAAMRMIAPELRYLWDALTANERRVLAVLASGFSPYRQEARLLTGLVNTSSAARSIERLEGKAIVERTGDEQLRIVDPLLARWVRRNGDARLQVHVLPQPAANESRGHRLAASDARDERPVSSRWTL